MTGKQKQDAVQRAAGELAAGRLPAAETICRELLAADPRCAEAWFTLGWVHHRARRSDAAIECFNKAIEIRRSDARYHNGQGVALMAAGRIDDAVAAFRKAVDLNSGYAEAHGNLAKALWLGGHSEQAGQAFLTAVRLAPDLAELRNNYGSFLRSRQQFAQAAAEHARASQLKPALIPAHYNLAIDYARQRKYEEAIQAITKVIQLRPDMIVAYGQLGFYLGQLERWDEAIVCLERVAQEIPSHAETRLMLSEAYDYTNQREKAIAECEQALRLAPQWEAARFQMDRLSGKSVPTHMPHQIVIGLFDEFAERFDRHLVETLGYRAPQMLHSAVRSVEPRDQLDIMDVGCGTGLCGTVFKPLARTLVGVDLSPRMIEQAQGRGVYDHLAVGDAVAALKARPDSFDLVVAGDVFIYLGDLNEVFAAARSSLRPGGLLAFNVEAHEGDGFVFQTTYRYAHSLAYIRGLAAAHHFIEAVATRGVLRKEHGADVNGFVIVLRKPA